MAEVHDLMTPIVELSQADYARHRGLTAKAIEKAIDAGRIPARAVRRDGRRKLIDKAAADFAWPLSNVRLNTEVENLPDSSPPVPGETASASPAAPRETPALTLARTETAQYDARIRRLEYEKRIGQALALEDVNRSMERCAEAIGGALDQLAGRADDLATAFTRDGVDGVRRLLKQISREIRAIAATNMVVLKNDAAIDDDDGDAVVAEAPPATEDPAS